MVVSALRQDRSTFRGEPMIPPVLAVGKVIAGISIREFAA